MVGLRNHHRREAFARKSGDVAPQKPSRVEVVGIFLMGITTTILLQQLPLSLLHAPSLSAGLINLAKA
jgi:hypothetical protein